jgi:Holliday junction resolvasome RuvABC endonuclease subunit
MKTILGIDVGMFGALAFYDKEELIIYDMPVFSRNKTNRLDCHTIAKIIRDQKPDGAMIEQVNAFGMGASSAYNFGWSCGAIEGILSACNIPFSYVTPQVWKKVMQCPKEKEAARMRATQLLPNFSHNWPLKKHDGRAEASLIALYAHHACATQRIVGLPPLGDT